MTKKTVVYRLPGVESVTVRRDLQYVTEPALAMDLYYPPDWTAEATPLPAVVIIAGYPDAGFERKLGCKFKDMGSSVSWAQLIAASGLVAITYTNRDPAPDCDALFDYLRQNAAGLGIDRARIGVYASSGNVPLALSLGKHLQCAALCYGFMLDLDGSSIVAEASKQFGFANPNAGKTVDDLPTDLPIFIVRAGADSFPSLNDTIDLFVAKSLDRNLPVTLVNYPAAPHAFDLFLDSETTHQVIRQILTFLRDNLLKPD